ncbi:hypothetical protein L208DRAFT_1379589 [Tricholoma matsutake]|nr:hypothetical protein L208DRAFT_1379589 [Tricholoma matsutake 945]
MVSTYEDFQVLFTITCKVSDPTPLLSDEDYEIMIDNVGKAKDPAVSLFICALKPAKKTKRTKGKENHKNQESSDSSDSGSGSGSDLSSDSDGSSDGQKKKRKKGAKAKKGKGKQKPKLTMAYLEEEKRTRR